MTEGPDSDMPAPLRASGGWAEWKRPAVLFALTLVSTLYTGATYRRADFDSLSDLLQGWTFAVPLMAILLVHELGHYIAGRRHGVDVSPPYFIPLPFLGLGTMGAVIRIRSAIRTRNALLDIGAAGPLAGLVVALPVLVIGILGSPVQALPLGPADIEGRSILYLALLRLLKGPIPPGHDIILNSTALAGWAGLLVTMMNLVPVAQLDGGHVAYALFGPRQDRYSERVRKLLPVVAVAASLYFSVEAWIAGARGEDLLGPAISGAAWLVWALVLKFLSRWGGNRHPPTGPAPLSSVRRIIAIGTLALFVLLFMPSVFRSETVQPSTQRPAMHESSDATQLAANV